MNDGISLPNVGPKLARAVGAVGIQSAEDLRNVGSVVAWRRIHPQFDCFHSLLALEGAVQGIPKSMLDSACRARLKAEAQNG